LTEEKTELQNKLIGRNEEIKKLKRSDDIKREENAKLLHEQRTIVQEKEELKGHLKDKFTHIRPK